MLNAHSVFPAARPRLEVHARCSTPNAFIINQFEAGRRRTFVVRCRPRDPRCDNGGQVGTEGRWTHVAWIWCNPHVTGLSSTQSHSLQGSLLGGFKDLRSAVNNFFLVPQSGTCPRETRMGGAEKTVATRRKRPTRVDFDLRIRGPSLGGYDNQTLPTGGSARIHRAKTHIHPMAGWSQAPKNGVQAGTDMFHVV